MGGSPGLALRGLDRTISVLRKLWRLSGFLEPLFRVKVFFKAFSRRFQVRRAFQGFLKVFR
eukprot:6201310-Amphidinium_carterae.1